MSQSNIKKCVSVKQALEMFDDIVDNLNLSLEYIDQGCEARAHLMCEYFKDNNVIPKKIWAFPDLRIQSGFDGRLFGKKYDWDYHVAPVIYVELKKGKAKPFVIDPVMFGGPVDIKRWAYTLGVENIEDKVEIVSLGVSPAGKDGDYYPSEMTDESTTIDALDQIRYCKGCSKSDETAPRKVYKSPLRVEFNARVKGRSEIVVKALSKFSSLM